MNPLIPPLLLMLVFDVAGQTVASKVTANEETRPVGIKADELSEWDTLAGDRKRLIKAALAVVNESPWLPYLAGGEDPDDGGLDCSGAMYHVMRNVGLQPPRSSGRQMEWLRKNRRFHAVSPDARDMHHNSFAALKPGDLLFWAKPDPDGMIRVHHVAMYLGTEKRDGRAVMIGSTDGRSYRGRKTNGYGVQDLRVPAVESPSRLVGYGTPHGMGTE